MQLVGKIIKVALKANMKLKNKVTYSNVNILPGKDLYGYVY